MGYVFFWIVFSFVVGYVGSTRKIGFWDSFLLSIFLSPLIGLIVTLVSKSLEDEAHKAKLLRMQQDQRNAIEKLAEVDSLKKTSIVEELEKLRKLKEENTITEEEFLVLKEKLINMNP